MKKMNGLALAVILLLVANNVWAQSYSETALLFSRTRPTGSARMLGMGGASVSLGADLTSAYSNPAGLGMYNRSEFSLSPGYMNLKNTGSYFSGDTQLSSNNFATRTNLSLPAFGMIFSKPQEDAGSFIQGSFGVTLTRINDFNSNLKYSSGKPNPNTSLIDYFIEQANGRTPDQFGSNGSMYNTVTELGYDNYLIGEQTIVDPNGDPTQYFSDISGMALQTETVQTKGGQNQWSFSYGANFNDKFFLGAGLGVVALNFQSEKSYREDFSNQPLNYFTLAENLQIKGTGINFTAGAIVRPVEGLQIGGSVTTPTRYNLTDTYSATMRSSWNNFQYDNNTVLSNESAQTDVITSGYNLNTPWRITVGGSYIFGKRGLVSVEIENKNYASAKYQSQTSGISYASDNNEIKSLYASTLNYRAGGEIRVKNYRFRAGGSYMPDPYKTPQNNASRSWTTASIGAGYRTSTYFIDFAYQYSWAGKLGDEAGNSYRPYTLNSANSPLLVYGQIQQNFIATIGFNF